MKALPALLLGLAVVGGIVLFARPAAAKGSAQPDVEPPKEPGQDGGGMSNKQRTWAMIMAVPGLDETQREFLFLTAYGESGGHFNPAAHNDSESERAAAAKGVTPTLASWASKCGVPLEHLQSGSWGVFQRLAPYFAHDVIQIFGENACELADPTKSGHNLALQIVSAVRYAHALQQYDAWQAYPTVGNLRLGWWGVAKLGYLSANKDHVDKYRRHAEDLHLTGGADFIDRQIAVFPPATQAMYAQLVNAAVS
jgi:hypothetical protein